MWINCVIIITVDRADDQNTRLFGQGFRNVCVCVLVGGALNMLVHESNTRHASAKFYKITYKGILILIYRLAGWMHVFDASAVIVVVSRASRISRSSKRRQSNTHSSEVKVN